ncbi:hypothetical protein NSB04_21405 [Blautia pseudococcoides]|nr:hypothetical protein [Blautia pseudococcoides]
MENNLKNFPEEFADKQQFSSKRSSKRKSSKREGRGRTGEYGNRGKKRRAGLFKSPAYEKENFYIKVITFLCI